MQDSAPPARLPIGNMQLLALVAGAAALYAIFVPITAIGTRFENLNERTLRMEEGVRSQIHNLDVTLQREYRMIAERLDSVAERATKDISEQKVELKKLQDELHALSIRLARTAEGGK